MIASWPERAACLRAEPRLFDPPVVGEFHFARARARKSNPRARMDQALSFCKVCPVVNECLADAVKNRESGIRGGQLVTDGRIVRLPVPTPQPQRPLKPCGTNAAWIRHRRAGEEPCIPCTQAHRTDRQQRALDRRRYRGAA